MGSLFFFILLHNVVASLLLVGLGLLFGIIPTMAICSNGFILGVVYRQAAETFGHTNAAIKMLPHGIFEIPALLIASSYGLWLGVTVVQNAWQGKYASQIPHRARLPAILRHRVPCLRHSLRESHPVLAHPVPDEFSVMQERHLQRAVPPHCAHIVTES
jgi:Stage II sporulation protein M